MRFAIIANRAEHGGERGEIWSLLAQCRDDFVVCCDWANNQLNGFSGSGLGGKFGVGILLGAVWSPCVEPTLGAVSLLTAQGNNLLQVMTTMLSFRVGAAVPLLALGLLSREVLLRWKVGMITAGKNLKMAFGAFPAITGILILTELDKTVESTLVKASPDWLTSLTIRF